MKLDGVHHIGVNVRDLDRAEAFYTEVLGFKVIDRYQEETRHSMLDTGAAKIHLFESTDLKFDEAIHRLSEDGYAHMAFGTSRERFPQVMAELKNNNIPFRGPLILGKGESVHFKDPDGNHLEIRCPAELS
ncbi:MAG: VOC family protein [Nitrospinota bacterium]|nr:VOC family protein [Nitrospinota bacterium]